MINGETVHNLHELLGWSNTGIVNCSIFMENTKGGSGQSKRLRPLGAIVLNSCIHFFSTFKSVDLPDIVPGGSLINSRTEIDKSSKPL